MSRPILVERLDSHTATAIYCGSCDWTGKQDDPSEGSVEDLMVLCPSCEKRDVRYLYEPGVRCAGCKKIDYTQPLRDDEGCYCSRRCQLQAEYARTLAEAAPSRESQS